MRIEDVCDDEVAVSSKKTCFIKRDHNLLDFELTRFWFGVIDPDRLALMFNIFCESNQQLSGLRQVGRSPFLPVVVLPRTSAMTQSAKGRRLSFGKGSQLMTSSPEAIS